jgi:hypothetical protein
MKRLTTHAVAGALLIGSAFFVDTARAQGTSADTALANNARSRVTDSLRIESARKQGIRKTVVTRLATRADSLLAAHLKIAAPVPVPLPAAPTASFAVVCAQYQCAFNAGASSGARITLTWDCGALPNCASTASAFSFSYPHEGSRTATLTVRDSLGRTASATRTFTVPGIPLPVDTAPTPLPPPVVVPPVDTSTITGDPTPPVPPKAVTPLVITAPTRTVRVGAADDLQAALNTATPGTEFRLAAGATFTGAFSLPVTCGAGTVTIRTDVDLEALVPEGQRMTPSKSAALAKIVSTSSQAALNIDGPSCNVHLLGLEFVYQPSNVAVINYGLFTIGDGGWRTAGELQVTLDRVPRNIRVDRVYAHGTSTSELVRCLTVNSINTAVVNSWFDDCHTSGFDAQAIEGWNGPGPFLIDNNAIIGSGENLMFGGADPAIPELIPADVTVSRNYFFKPLEWRGRWSLKNLFELKNVRRIRITANRFKNSPPASQEGMAIVIKSSIGGDPLRAWQGTTDVDFDSNIIEDASVGLNLQAVDCSGQACTDVHVQRVRVVNNLFTGIGTFPNRNTLMLLTHDLKDVLIAHNTMLHATSATYGLPLTLSYGGGLARNMVWRDNVFTAPSQYLAHFSDSGVESQVNINALRGFVRDGSWSFQRNVVGGIDPQYLGALPSTSWYPSTVAAIGLAADYSLLATSPYKAKGLGGTDPGADIAELTRRTAGVVVAP